MAKIYFNAYSDFQTLGYTDKFTELNQLNCWLIQHKETH